MKQNIIFTLDSYKQIHAAMYPKGTQYIYSYLEARRGSEYTYTVFFGLQYILKKWLEGVVLTKEMIDEAEPILKEHFKFNGDIWKRDKWDYIVNKHGGRLPVRIKAVPEGTKVSINNVLMTIENTDVNCFWLTNALETVLQQVWYPITVATRSHSIVSFIREQFKETVDDSFLFLADYYLHDFGQRGVSCMEQAGLGGMAHLVNSYGTDTDMAIPFAINYYNANYKDLSYSVPASEHSIATSLGKDGEFEVVKSLIKTFPEGILSHVSDSYNIEAAVKTYCNELKPYILNRKGKFVIRPDSPRFIGDTAADQILWITQELEKGFGVTVNSKGYKVLHESVGIIYGDSLTEKEIKESLLKLKENKFSATTCVFGQGGGLLQKLNRDTCRFAFKASAQCRKDVWYGIFKEPSDKSKASKRGKLKLVYDIRNKTHETLPDEMRTGYLEDCLVPVFENGNVLINYSLSEVRSRAKS